MDDDKYISLIRKIKIKRSKKLIMEYCDAYSKSNIIKSYIVESDIYLQKVLSCGKIIIPFIIEFYENEINILYPYILYKLTGNNPIKASHEGMFALIRLDWLEWWKNNKEKYTI